MFSKNIIIKKTQQRPDPSAGFSAATKSSLALTASESNPVAFHQHWTPTQGVFSYFFQLHLILHTYI